jgi:hypothetical protein
MRGPQGISPGPISTSSLRPTSTTQPLRTRCDPDHGKDPAAWRSVAMAGQRAARRGPRSSHLSSDLVSVWSGRRVLAELEA